MTIKLVMYRDRREPLGFCLLASDDLQEEQLQKIPPGQELIVEIKQPRNPNHHRLFFALLNITQHQTDDFPSTDMLLTWLKIKLGHVDVMIWDEGKTYYVPKSISFASMDQDSFREFFDRALDVIVQRYGFDRPALLKEIEQATGLHWSNAA